MELSPLFMNLVIDQIEHCSTRKLGEWLGVDNILDAKEIRIELERRKANK